MSLDSSEPWRVIETRDQHGSPYQKLLRKNDYEKGERASSNQAITLTFAVKQNNIEDLALSIADPSSPNYGKHLTRDQVESLTRNTDGEDAVRAYLDRHHIKISDHSSKSYVSAEAPVGVWEAAIQAEFYQYRNTNTGETLIRTDRYSLPESLANHVHSVLNTVQFPAAIHGGPRMSPLTPDIAEALSK